MVLGAREPKESSKVRYEKELDDCCSSEKGTNLITTACEITSMQSTDVEDMGLCILGNRSSYDRTLAGSFKGGGAPGPRTTPEIAALGQATWAVRVLVTETDIN